MGAIIAAQCALQWDWQQMVEQTMALCQKGDQMTLPLVSLFSGYRVIRAFRQMFADTQIEDLWYPFFTVSCNLSRATVMTHRSGSLSEAVLYSNTPPGLLPPRVVDGDLHVDGALLNNMPADVMRGLIGDGTVIAVDVSQREEMLHNTPFDSGLGGWQLLLEKMRLGKSKRHYPGIKDILSRASIIGGLAQQQQVREGVADLYLTPPVSGYTNMSYRQGMEIMEAGYRHALAELELWQPPHPLCKPED